jgi:protein-disulfide isomerase
MPADTPPDAATPPAITDDDHVRGPANARVTLVEYADFQCPFSGRAYRILPALQERLGEPVRLVFRHFPKPHKHPDAQRAAEIAEAAGEQGRFWEMHDALFEGPSLGADAVLEHAQRLDLDVDRVRRELAENAHADRIRSDVTGGRRAGVTGTPTFFVNGVRHDGDSTLPALLTAVHLALTRTGPGG